MVGDSDVSAVRPRDTREGGDEGTGKQDCRRA